MAKLIDEIQLAWSSIQSAQGTSGWSTVAVVPSRPGKFLAGRNFPDKCEALIAGFHSSTLPRNEKLPEGLGFQVTRLEIAQDGLTWLALTRSKDGNLELFSAMVSNVVEAVLALNNADDSRDLRVFLGRIRAWQEFMRKGAVPLTAENEVGLIGELIFLEAMLKAGVAADIAVNSWVGPTADGVRDFALGFGAIEVKTTISSNGFVAKIASLEQLDDANCKPIFLGAFRLALTETGQTLPDKISEICELFDSDPVTKSAFQDRLLAAGYLLSHAHHYHRRFSFKEMVILEIDHDFPCMTHGNVKTGVISARYEINLEPFIIRDVGLPFALKKLEMI
jgi:Putative  PD-(D/E)XK family member, (DUF4420)